MPKVSVIVPIYNVEKYIREAVDSILAQKLTDLEIILIDDGCTDNCPKIIDEYATKDSRIIAIHKEDKGYGECVNYGLNIASGEYIAILEPDDFIDDSMYEELYAIAKKYDSDIVKSRFYDYFQTQDENIAKTPNWANDLIPQSRSFTIAECPLFFQYHPSIWSCLYKREFLNENKLRFNEIFGGNWVDNPFQVATLCLAKKINYTPKAYYYWRKIYSNDAERLKDYTIPFNRSFEIHSWLKEHNIKDRAILENLACRELSYINLVLEKKNISNLKDCIKRIFELLELMNVEMVLNSDVVKKGDKKNLRFLIKHPYIYRYRRLFDVFRREIFSIRWNKKDRCIKLFGKFLYKKNEVI